ncbi:MAG: elongation factor P [Patescibacteria group bacterium]
MALSPQDLKKGAVFTLDGQPYVSTDYKQKVMGRGSSVVTVKAKNLRDGKVTEKTFRGSENLGEADVQKFSVQFLYSDGTTFFFMDPESYEQYELNTNLVGEFAGYLVEEQKLSIVTFEGSPISIEMPKNVWLEVEYTEPAVKGDTSTSILKDARMTTGLTVKVPIFIKNGDIVSVDTESGEYRERKKD